MKTQTVFANNLSNKVNTERATAMYFDKTAWSQQAWKKSMRFLSRHLRIIFYQMTYNMTNIIFCSPHRFDISTDQFCNDSDNSHGYYGDDDIHVGSDGNVRYVDNYTEKKIIKIVLSCIITTRNSNKCYQWWRPAILILCLL